MKINVHYNDSVGTTEEKFIEFIKVNTPDLTDEDVKDIDFLAQRVAQNLFLYEDNLSTAKTDYVCLIGLLLKKGVIFEKEEKPKSISELYRSQATDLMEQQAHLIEAYESFIKTQWSAVAYGEMSKEQFSEKVLNDDLFAQSYGMNCVRDLTYTERCDMLHQKRLKDANGGFVSPGVYTTEPGPSDKYLDSENIPKRILV